MSVQSNHCHRCNLPMIDYRSIADAIANDIATGRLRPGDRLLPQREFAYRRGIAPSTAGRVYAELARRRLAVGEVGRGTFVAARTSRNGLAYSEPTGPRIDLEHLFPILPAQETAIARALAVMLRSKAVVGVLDPIPANGTASGRGVAARFLSRPGWAATPDRLLFTGNGKQALAAVVATLVPRGGRLGVEAFTFATIKKIAEHLGVALVPLAMDEGGIRVDRLKVAHRQAPLSALYLQPVLHNPLGLTMPMPRRQELTRIARSLDLMVIEDAVNTFLLDEPPLAALMPEHCIVVDSLSKRIAPGLTAGVVVPPSQLVDRVAGAIRAGAWQAPAFAYNAVTYLMHDGTAASIVRAKREDAAARQALAKTVLSDFAVKADPRAYHLWLELPKPWRSHQLVTAAAEKGIALSPSSTFAIREAHAPNAVRIALPSAAGAELRGALEMLAWLLRSRPEDVARVG
jgi:DNA-binding transcriptional MocR family regulator